MKLYYSRGACSLAVHIVLHETGLPFEVERVDSKTKVMDSGGDFRTISPNGYVPVLVLDSGEQLTEVQVILQYVADLQPGAGLAPLAGTMPRYHLMEWLSFVSSELHKSYSPLFWPNTPEEFKTILKERIGRRLAYVEGKLAGRQYLTGDQFTIADAYLYVVVNWSRSVNVDLTPYPSLQQFHERVAKRPAAQSALRTEGLLK